MTSLVWVKPLVFGELKTDLYIEGTEELKAQLRAIRAERIFESRMSDTAGTLTANLSAIAEAVGAFVGLDAVSKRVQAVAVAGQHLEHDTAPAQPAARVPVFDLQGQIDRHRDAAVRRDELTRRRALDEYEAIKRATARPEEPEAGSITPKVDRGACVKRDALIARNIRRWTCIERHLKDASSNGLSAAAKAELHGFWWEGDALKWASVRNYLSAPEVGALALTGVVHRMAN